MRRKRSLLGSARVAPLMLRGTRPGRRRRLPGVGGRRLPGRKKGAARRRRIAGVLGLWTLPGCVLRTKQCLGGRKTAAGGNRSPRGVWVAARPGPGRGSRARQRCRLAAGEPASIPWVVR